jgi:hypothetical protein
VQCSPGDVEHRETLEPPGQKLIHQARIPAPRRRGRRSPA